MTFQSWFRNSTSYIYKYSPLSLFENFRVGNFFSHGSARGSHAHSAALIRQRNPWMLTWRRNTAYKTVTHYQRQQPGLHRQSNAWPSRGQQPQSNERSRDVMGYTKTAPTSGFISCIAISKILYSYSMRAPVPTHGVNSAECLSRERHWRTYTLEPKCAGDGWNMVKSFCSARDLSWGSLGDWG